MCDIKILDETINPTKVGWGFNANLDRFGFPHTILGLQSRRCSLWALVVRRQSVAVVLMSVKMVEGWHRISARAKACWMNGCTKSGAADSSCCSSPANASVALLTNPISARAVLSWMLSTHSCCSFKRKAFRFVHMQLCTLGSPQ